MPWDRINHCEMRKDGCLSRGETCGTGFSDLSGVTTGEV